MMIQRHSRVIPSVSRQRLCRKSPLCQGLQFFSYLNKNAIDLVTGKPGRTSNNAVNIATQNGEVLSEPGALDYLAFDNHLNLTDEWSILVVANITGFYSWGALFGIPYFYPGWSYPHQALSLIASSTTARHRFATGPDGRTDSSMANFWELDTKHAYIVTRRGINMEWYRSGEHIGSSTTQPLSIDLSNNGAVCFGVRSDLSIGEGVSGEFYVGGVWNRALNVDEVALLSRNMLAPLNKRRLWSVANNIPTFTSDIQPEIESLAAVSASNTMSFESLGSVFTSNSILSVESLQTLQNIFTTHIESLTEIDLVQGFNIESLSAIAAQPSLTIESLTSVSAGRSAAIESLSSVTHSDAVSIENLQAVQKYILQQYEALRSLQHDTPLMFEALGDAGFTAQAIIAFESLGDVSSTQSISVESLQHLSASQTTVFESLVSFNAEFYIQVEGLLNVQKVSDFQVEALVSISADQFGQFESLAAVSGTATLSIETLRAIAHAANIPFEALQAEGVNVIVDVVTKTAYFSLTVEHTATFNPIVTKIVTFH